MGRRQSDNGCPAGYEPADGSGSSGSSASFGNNANAFRSMSPEQRERMVTAHGALAALAFVGLFPIGGILIRLASFTGLVWVHAALQLVAYAIYIAAFGLGVWQEDRIQDLVFILPSNDRPRCYCSRNHQRWSWIETCQCGSGAHYSLCSHRGGCRRNIHRGGGIWGAKEEEAGAEPASYIPQEPERSGS